MKNNELSWLMNWFDLHCGGHGGWEHMFGVLIETNEEPGWTVSIDLEDTDLEGLEFTPIDRDISSNDWLHCSVKDNAFLVKTSSKNLLESLSIFRHWAEPLYGEIYEMPTAHISDDQMLWLINWYDCCCSKGLSCKSRIRIATLDNPGWNFYVDLRGTGLETDTFKVIHVDRTEEDWYHCFIRDNIFRCPGGNFNLGEALQMFRNFVESSAINDNRRTLKRFPLES